MERRQEEEYLKECVSIIKGNVEEYEAKIKIADAQIKDMYERYRDDDPEIFTELSNTITMNNNMKMALNKNLRALKKPYFGRVDIINEMGEPEKLYIGKGGVMKDALTIIVVDWRAPIANIYYENGLGPCSFVAPQNNVIEVDLKRKRTYEIDGDRLIDYFDSEVIANDELLTKYLAKNKEAVLGEIIATIQKEQNDIIRKTPYHNVIVQGVAGSGKTTVAMHRISYIMYNYAKDFRAEDFYIVGSNQILLNYITGVLPDLDVYGIKQMTMEQLFIRLLYEDWQEGKYTIVPCSDESSVKGKAEWFEALKSFCERLEVELIERRDIYFEDKIIYSKEQLERYIYENPGLSIQLKINGLNERVLNRLKNEITGKELSYPVQERRRLIKEYKYTFGRDKWKGASIYKLYEEFLMTQGHKGALENIAEGRLDVYDLAALAYLYKRVKETDPICEARHIVVDEAQDFGMMAYSVLKFCIPMCTWTIMGDVSQNIHFGFGMNDWEELKALLITNNYDSFGVLSKSYRNTVEISQFAQGILAHGSFYNYPIEPIIRHGNPVETIKCDSKNILDKSVEILCEWQKKDYETIAVVCRDVEAAKSLEAELGKYIDVMPYDEENATFKVGIMVLPVEYTKGLEFDAVLIYNPDKSDYPVDNGHAKLLYVAATRALHELKVVYEGELTGLI